MRTEPIRWSTEELLAQSGWLSALARRLVRDPSEADDIVQDTWIAALEHRPERDRPLRPWLAAVARNFARMRRRASMRREAREEVAHARVRSVPTPAELSERLEGQRVLVETLLEIAEPYRSTLLLVYFDELSSEEIARSTGVPASTVRWRLAQAIEQLRTALDRRHRGDRGAWIAAFAPLARVQPTVVKSAAVAGPGVLLVMTTWKGIACALTIALIAWGIFESNRTRSTSASGVVLDDAQLASLAAPNEVSSEPRDASAEARRESLSAARAAIDAGARLGDQSTPSTAIRARLVTERGEPLAGAKLAVDPRSIASTFATSSTYGIVALSLEPREGESIVDVHASATGRATRALRASVRSGAIIDLGDVKLAPGGSIEGRVLDPEGRPVAKAYVKIDLFELAAGDRANLRRLSLADRTTVPETITDEGGRFELAGVPVGYARLAVGGEAWLTTFTDSIAVRAESASAPITVELDPLPNEDLVMGLVVDSAGNPAAFAIVDGGSVKTVADRDGTFRLRAPIVGPIRLVARAAHDAGGRSEPTMVARGARDVRLVLAPRIEISIAARATSGATIENYAVRAFDPDDDANLAAVACERHVDGSSRIDAPPRAFVVEIDAPGFELARQGPFAAGVPEQLEFVLARVPSACGFVRSAANGTDRPLASAIVRAFRSSPDPFLRDGFRVDRDPRVLARTTSAADGSFALTLREAGDFVLRFESADTAPTELALDAYDPRAGRSGLIARLDEGGAIEGRVLVDTNANAAGSIVAFSRADGFAFTRRVDADGRFRAPRLMPGPWEVRLVDEELPAPNHGREPPPGWDQPRWNCVVPADGVAHCDLVAGADVHEIDGVVSIAGARPGPWTARLRWNEGQGGRRYGDVATLDLEGRFHLTVERAGEYQLTLMAIGGELDGLWIVAPIELSAASIAWKLELRTARIRIEDSTPRDPLHSTMLVWSGENRTYAIARPKAEAPVADELVVPAGTWKLVRFDEELSETDPPAWPSLDTGEVAPGGRITLRRR